MATLETSLFWASASPFNVLDAVPNSPDNSDVSATELTDMSGKQVRLEAPRESMASIPRDLMPFTSVIDEKKGAAEELSKNPLAEGLQDSLKDKSLYLMGLSSSMQFAVEPEALFKEISSLVCKALMAHTPPILSHPSSINDSSAPPQVGGELTSTDIEASPESLVKMLVT